ncbi:hypothetical protein [Chitinophaga sp. Cy-1792]|uniref:hypothetical protein n=1 Tax=Chitinophaga sp. Cy-1792 TaxID=2608339 RepID=UPI00141E171A|nr:hypothetical protein [Chitinophaga sp. Cy-1792]NIG56489.1 hypothetical protein [Chitinophaga sp. Cy-1792]
MYLKCISIFLLTTMLLSTVAAQEKKPAPPKHFTMKDLTGIWLRDISMPGDNLGQRFQFSPNGQFVFYPGDDRDDLRTIFSIYGKYRLDTSYIYFTVLKKKIWDGDEIGAGEPLVGNIFEINTDKTREILIKNPHELDNGCVIEVVNANHIILNYTHYYKVAKKYLSEGDYYKFPK